MANFTIQDISCPYTYFSASSKIDSSDKMSYFLKIILE